ncbi:MAG: nitroreductase family deazaflavin-dependent oxidoreductase [Ktedonobacteraceae bacterium]|nr:nitroreductase family deazaflavin-dependent oxidoreductase [Ktedonobacteraceae bacterium]
MANALFAAVNRLLVRTGLRPNPISSLTVVGRKTSKAYTVQVRVIEHNGQRWLVAPYGEVNWVRNIRAAGGQAILTSGRTSHVIRVEEVSSETAAPVLKQYLSVATAVHPHFNVTPESPLAEFAAEAPRHPVFRIVRAELR